ncbi:alpha/beta hydrolase [Cellulomonas sp.]|uniref:alpha/beta fold hydrolase n=1 Tax=Cellulomonas sp. TaxID=40001 RepID=UPI001B0BB0AF|nr:alpha/beta hydrolase [Cellulomonas sp.]MBO9556211.1 alpha/beta hydrolase [Cellulomonas sp.]
MTNTQTSTTAPSGPAERTSTVHVVLVPGFWLGAWAWDRVLPGLRAAGLEPHALTLPGLEAPDADRSQVTFDDHVRAVLDVVAGLDGDVVLVGHSGGGMVVQHVLDRAVDRVRRVVYVDSGPLSAGRAIDPSATGVDHPLPSWDELAAQGSSMEGMDDELRAEIARRAVPHPARVASAEADPRDPRRLSVPATIICTSIPSGAVQGMFGSGVIPAEVPDMTDVTYVDLPTGHWPMLSRPDDLAAAIAAAALG